MNKKLVFGVGVNDSNYTTTVVETVGYKPDGKRVQKVVWKCPFYTTWTSMIRRSYSGLYKKTFPSYTDCSVCDEWLTFSNFKSWMERQDYEGKHLDKDLLVRGNKIYSPATCVFVDKEVNYFMTERESCRGSLPIGVSISGNKYKACISGGSKTSQEYLGLFSTPEEAHQAWLAAKLERAKVIAAKQNNTMIANAIIDKYKNY